MDKNRSPLIYSGIMAAAVVVWMASGLLSAKDKPAQEQAGATRHLFKVRAIHSSASLITRETKVNARTEPDRSVTVRAELSGQVISTGVERGKKIREGEVIATLEGRDRQALLAQAEAVLRQQQLELDSARRLAAQGLKSKAELASAEALLEAAKAALEAARLDLERCIIRAPFDGYLSERFVEKGDFLSPGSEVARVASLNPIVVMGYLTEQEIIGVHTGSKANATLSTGEKVEGTIGYISPEADVQSRMYKVELDVPNPDGRILAGLTAELRVPHEETQAHFISPAHIMLSDSGSIGLLIADEEGLTSFIPISIVNTSPEGLWIQGELPEKCIIVTTGKDFVSPGQKVLLAMENEPLTTDEAAR